MIGILYFEILFIQCLKQLKNNNNNINKRFIEPNVYITAVHTYSLFSFSVQRTPDITSLNILKYS